jgi:sigma-E factor negative regulatory protein RseC
MQQKGCVIRIDGGKAVVRIAGADCGASSCHCCEAFAGEKRPEVTADNTLSAQLGDSVVIEFDTWQAIHSAAVLFLVPILAVLIGVLGGYQAGAHWFPGQEEPFAALAGLGMLGLSLLGITWYDRKLRKKEPTVPVIVGIEKPECCSMVSSPMSTSQED